jgi:cyanophycinase-like exopeptidase
MVDPSNKNASIAEGIRAMDIYLANPNSKMYRAQGQAIKRVAVLTQSLRAQQAQTKVVGRDTVFVTREDEITALKDQLAKANAELDRIKKRLANPSR